MTTKHDFEENKKLKNMCEELCEEMSADTIIITRWTNYAGRTVYTITGNNKYSERYIW